MNKNEKVNWTVYRHLYADNHINRTAFIINSPEHIYIWWSKESYAEKFPSATSSVKTFSKKSKPWKATSVDKFWLFDLIDVIHKNVTSSDVKFYCFGLGIYKSLWLLLLSSVWYKYLLHSILWDILLQKTRKIALNTEKRESKKYPGYFKRQWFLLMKYPGAKVHFCYFNHRICLNNKLFRYIQKNMLFNDEAF